MAVVLFLAALPLRWACTTGDLWLDEADYAFAAVRGPLANAWDRSDTPEEPQKMLRLRHFHPPFTAYAVEAALALGPADRTLRVPFVLSGAATVALLYLCGVTLFEEHWRAWKARRAVRAQGGADSPPTAATAMPRAVAAACAFMLLVSPAHLRASSHVLPWSFIALWLLAVVWTLMEFASTRQPGWLVGTGAALGAMFVTSEYFFPTLAAVLCALPLLLWPDVRDRARRRAVLRAIGWGVVAPLGIGLALWPAGILCGDAPRMLQHYVAMAGDAWPVTIRGHEYARAPKTAYAIWYWDLFRPYAVLYGVGLVAAIGLLAARRLRPGGLALLVVTLVMLITAHRSHIIGPEYLVHSLPLLTVLGGLALLAVVHVQRTVGLMATLLACLWTGKHRDPSALSGMDERARLSRWPAAAAAIAARWQPGDQVLAPAYGGVARWYLLRVAGVRAKEWQVQGYPAASELLSNTLLRAVTAGGYRFVAVGSTFVDTPSINPKLARIVDRWPVLWRSDERGTGPSRLTVYVVPRGVTSRTPLRSPR